MLVGGNQYLYLNYKIKRYDFEYSLSCTIGTASNSEHGHKKQVILLKISNTVKVIGQTHL